MVVEGIRIQPFISKEIVDQARSPLSATKISSADASALSALSRSERLQALSKTGLVQHWTKGDFRTGISVIDGVITTNHSSDEWPVAFSEELLSEDDPIGLEAKEIFLSRNRIVLDGNLKSSLRFLEDMEESVQHIRLLDVAFRLQVFELWWQSGSTMKEDWQHLAQFIADKLKIEDLDLSLDAGQVYEDWKERGVTEDDIPSVREVHSEIVDILATALQGRKPRCFQVFWAAFHDQEAQAEKRIMGDEYDSGAMGKEPPEKRIYWYPHGLPRNDLNWRGGMSL